MWDGGEDDEGRRGREGDFGGKDRVVCLVLSCGNH